MFKSVRDRKRLNRLRRRSYGVSIEAATIRDAGHYLAEIILENAPRNIKRKRALLLLGRAIGTARMALTTGPETF